MDIFLGNFKFFLVIWARIASMAFTVPPLSSAVIPQRAKLGLSFLFAMLLFSSVTSNDDYQFFSDISMMTYALVIFKEFVVGMVIGFMVTIFISVFELSAEIFSIQMGLGFANIVDPSGENENSLLGYLFYLFVMLVFFNMGGFYMILNAIADSFKKIPIVNFLYNSEGFIEMSLNYFSYMFVLALKIALPVILMTLIMSIVVGLLGKAAPQANLLLLGLPLQWGLGIIALIVVIPFSLEMFFNLFPSVISDSIQYLSEMVRGEDA